MYCKTSTHQIMLADRGTAARHEQIGARRRIDRRGNSFDLIRGDAEIDGFATPGGNGGSDCGVVRTKNLVCPQ